MKIRLSERYEDLFLALGPGRFIDWQDTRRTCVIKKFKESHTFAMRSEDYAKAEQELWP